MDPKVRRLLERARAGQRLSPEEGLLLYREAPTEALGEVAHELRLRRGNPPQIVTYLIDRNINYTNVCVTACQFCAFYRPLGHPEAYVRTKEEIGARLEALRTIGGTRVLMQGGHHPDLPLSWYEDLLAWMRSHYPEIEINAFSPSEIDHIARLEGLSYREVLGRLQAAGLAGLPGGGAEILVDRVRRDVSPKKIPAAVWLEVMEVAQELGLATTATMVIGFGETLEDRIEHLTRLRDLQDRSLAAHGNGFTAFISWTAMTENTALERRRDRERFGKVLREEYLRNVALARIYLDNFAHIQASWPTQGEETARIALTFGADDFGSTMMEENVVSAAGAVTAVRCLMSPEDLRRNIRQAGFVPAQRDTRYRILRVFADPVEV